jgi:hypothetical protein
MTDQISWDACPRSGDVPAIGWDDDEPAEFDCRRGCELTDAELAELTRQTAPASLLRFRWPSRGYPAAQ